MQVWSQVVALSIGGAIGVNARYWLGVWIETRTGPGFPWATFAINVSGAFLIGLLAVLLGRFWPFHTHTRLLAISGLLGGYTTFSTFAYESARLWERGQVGHCLANLLGSVAAGFLAVVLGIALAQRLLPPEINPALPRVAPDDSAGSDQ